MTPSALHRPILALAIAALPLAGAQGAIKQIDKSGKWTAHLLTEKNKRICFVHSEPTKKVGQYTRRGDVFVVATGTSKRHVMTLAEEAEMQLKAHDRRPLRREGMDDGTWVLLDYGDVIVHVFDAETREYYDLERLWADAPRLAYEPAAS